MKRFLKYWLPAVVWLGVIFFGSTDLMSAEHTSRILIPFLLWLKPTITIETVMFIQFLVRKAAHFIEYAILAVVVWRALYRGTNLRMKMSPKPAKPRSSFGNCAGVREGMKTEGAGRPSRLTQSAARWVQGRSIPYASVWIAATLVAAADEYHQSFVPSRGAAWGDVLIDSSGAIFGLLICSAWAGRKSRASESRA